METFFFSRLSVLLAIRYGKFVVLCRITPVFDKLQGEQWESH